ncbi:MAG: molybdopterin-dependent oxidoreductase [Paludisphaera borealis]|uniref:xanthine dehydrogenase family protein molybdopterin-binding subunit n=1 Tax=Paludisphaera borealis TaxID=1387353 RepID=UPI0028429DCC|nr:molybdopterin cofactor-binding domain-containing protein [Paludisphaera borealis]MDR3623177.1 molybdopterin-dependent oxidoreductase [Paludisphaera borealis]
MIPRHDWQAESLKAVGLSDDYEELVDLVDYHFVDVPAADPNRREVLKTLGAGLLIAVAADSAHGQQPGRGQRPGGGRRGGGGSGATSVAARVHIGQDGGLTVMTGKVECGQGARAELSQAAAEELRVPIERVALVMADTALVPDDGGTYGSRSTPSTIPAIRAGCASARLLLVALAAQRWGVEAAAIDVQGGQAKDEKTGRTLTYADLATDAEAAQGLARSVSPEVALTPVASWRTMGVSVPRPNGRDIVAGSHQYPSDVVRPGMLYGKVLRAPSFGATLESVDLNPARAMEGVVAVRDGGFVGVAAPTTARARKALDAIAATAKWRTAPHPSSAELPAYLRAHAEGGIPANPFADEVANAAKSLKRSYDVAYIQHAPMEPRAAVAEWEDGRVTAWLGTQVPFGVRGELARAFGLPEDRARVITPDFGGGFGGKHSGEYAVEAARLAKEAGKPVRIVWTRPEEFTWAQFRPAAAIEAEASLDAQGKIATWRFLNINSGAGQVQTPYRVGRSDARFIPSAAPLRHGSYRALASTANTFGRECFMDELAELAGVDPLAFRLAHLGDPRLRAVLVEAASRFDWPSRLKSKTPGQGVGLACGMDKGGFVAACASVSVDRDKGTIRVDHVCQVYECGKIINPANLLNQVKGAVVMGLGPALREASEFSEGVIRNASFGAYRVPRFADLPTLDVHLLDRPDLASAGAGETPIIAVAPAVANAVFNAIGLRIRRMPIRLPNAKDEPIAEA